VIEKDLDFWQARVREWLGGWLTRETTVQEVAEFAEKTSGRKNLDGFAGDPRFITDNYAPKMFSKWRSSVANLYAWRLGIGFVEMPPEYMQKNEAKRQALALAADCAFKQAFAICPYSPEVVFGYVNFLTKQGRKADALTIAHAAVIVDPKNGVFRDLEKNLVAEIQSTSDSRTQNLAVNTERLKDLQTLKVQKEAEYAQKKAQFEKLKTMNREELRKALPGAASDLILSNRLAELKLAEADLADVRAHFDSQAGIVRSRESYLNGLQHQIEDRIDGIMLGLDAKLAYYDAYLKTIDKDIEELRRAQ